MAVIGKAANGKNLAEQASAIITKHNLQVKTLPIGEVRPYPRNPRTHSESQIQKLRDSFRAYGIVRPILIDKDRFTIAGAACVEAAKREGIAEIPTIQIENLSDEKLRAYRIADNQLATLAGWDEEILASELRYICELEGVDFDATITGFETPEIDLIIQNALKSSSIQLEDEPQLSQLNQPPVSATGDVWLLSKHKVACGNSLEETSYHKALGAKRAAAVFSDNPYNYKISGHATGNGAIQHAEFAMASGELTSGQFLKFLNCIVALLVQFTVPGSVHYLCMDWRNIDLLLAAIKQNYGALLNLCVWVKDNGGMGSHYRSQFELIAVARNGAEMHRNNIQLGRFGRNRTNVWQYPGIGTMSRQSEEGNLLALHPTVKPVAMVADAILDCTKRGDIVLDPFLGSGTTLIAAEKTGRVCCGIEIEPRYVDTAIRRWQKYTGQQAVHQTSGKAFDEIAVREEKLCA